MKSPEQQMADLLNMLDTPELQDNTVTQAVRDGLVKPSQVMQSIESRTATKALLIDGGLGKSEYFNRKQRLVQPYLDADDIANLPKPNPIGNANVNPYDKVNDRFELANRRPISESHLKYISESEMRSTQAFLGEISPSLVSTVRMATSNSDNRIPTHLEMHNREVDKAKLAIENPRYLHAVKFNLDRRRLNKVKIANKGWFSKLQVQEQQMYKVCGLSNPGVCHALIGTDADSVTQLDTDALFRLIPRYADDSIQPCNLIWKGLSGTMGAVSIAPCVRGLGIHFKLWNEGLSNDSHYYLETSTGLVVRIINDVALLLSELATELLNSTVGLIAGMFEYRRNLYQRQVEAKLKLRKSVSNDDIKKITAVLYTEDYSNVDNTQTAEEFLITCSDLGPKIAVSRITQLGKHTGVKKTPHDRGEHKNFRYNADGTVRLEWDVAAQPINGGIAERLGLQISRILN